MIKFPFVSQLIYMTNWGNQLAIVSTALTLYLGKDHHGKIQIKNARRLVAATVLTLEFGLAMQIMVMIVYWPLIHDYVMEDIKGLNDDVVYWIMILIHSWPFLTVFLNVAMTKTIFIYEHYRYLLYVGVIYTIINFVATKVKGKPLYDFLHWNDMSSLIYAIFLNVIAISFYLGMCFLVNSVKNT